MEVYLANLKRYFGRTRAVDNISFAFGQGQIFGFIGPNGAGKTTAMRIIATLDEPDSGDIYVGGKSVVQDPEAVRRIVGFMPDSLPAHRDISVHEYLDFFARAFRIHNPRRHRVVEQVEEFTGLTSFREKMLNELSKGMKQRVSLARAIVHEPSVLVLDEPAAGLDPRARIELRELLKALRDQGKAILISSHILSELGEMCDGAVFIEQGKLLRAGTMDTIMQSIGTEVITLIRAHRMVPETLLKYVLEAPHVVEAKIVGREVAVRLDGHPEDQQESCTVLLKGLVQRGVPVLEFYQKKVHLEDLFMNITKGQLQ